MSVVRTDHRVARLSCTQKEHSKRNTISRLESLLVARDPGTVSACEDTPGALIARRII
jgi:hypothetical protein